MSTRRIGIVIDGATGRLGTTQHLRALLAIRGEGGLPLANGDRLMPEPVLLGRNPEKLAALAEVVRRPPFAHSERRRSGPAPPRTRSRRSPSALPEPA